MILDSIADFRLKPESMKKRIVVSVIAILTLASFYPAEAQRSKVHRVGVLMLIKPDRPQLQGLRDGLRDAGYIEGQNLTLEMRPLQSAEELRSLAKDYVKQKINVIVTTGNVETNVAKEIIQELPIVFMPASDPITAGFVKSFPRPGSNLTGIALIRDLDSYGKQLEVFQGDHPFFGQGRRSLRRPKQRFPIHERT